MTKSRSQVAGELDRDDLITSNLDLVQHVVNQVALRYPRHVDRQELWNAGALGLVDAARRYDESTGIPFGRYAMIRIRGAIIDSTRSRDWATRATRRGIRELREVSEGLEQEFGREPEPAEIAEAMGVTTDHLENLRGAAVASSLLHLDQRVGSAEGEETTLGELIEEREAEVLPQDQLEHREMVGTLREAVEHLPEVQRTVVIRYYFGNEYLRDIADSLGVTEARVSQIRSEGLNAIRAYFSSQFDGVEAVDEQAPGRRNRAAFLAAMESHSTWRTRLDHADAELMPA